MPHIDMAGRCFTFFAPYLAIFMPTLKASLLFQIEIPSTLFIQIFMKNLSYMSKIEYFVNKY